MKTLLQINSSLYSDRGQSSQLASQFAARWQAATPDGRVVVRDLAADPIPHLSAERFQAFLTAAEQRNAEQNDVVGQSDRLIEELAMADTVALGLPMYNFGIPSTLKTWIDHVARAGRTFKYTANGAVGLLADRKVVVFATRGGKYQGTPGDTQSAHIKDFFNFIGIRGIEFVYAEGLALGDDARRDALDKAARAINAAFEKIAA